VSRNGSSSNGGAAPAQPPTVINSNNHPQVADLIAAGTTQTRCHQIRGCFAATERPR
jgi:hypothetical protein